MSAGKTKTDITHLRLMQKKHKILSNACIIGKNLITLRKNQRYGN